MATHRRRFTIAAATAGALVVTGGLAALAAGTGTVAPPPRIAFVARSDNPADALAVGPTAGQLGAPVFVTAPGTLVPSTQAGLTAYSPELVIIAGGEAAIAPGVEAAIESALSLPDDKVVRAAGSDRHETAVKISELLAAHNPAYLPVQATATDSDLFDGMDSVDFLKTSDAVDAETIDGVDSSELARTPLWANIASDGTILSQSGGISVVSSGSGGFWINVGEDVSARPIQATLRYANTGGESSADGEITVGVCGTSTVVCVVAGTNNPNHVYVFTSDPSGSGEAKPFYLEIKR